MKSPPLVLLCILLLLCFFLAGCASTTQTMQPPGGAVTLNIGSPDNPAELHGVTVVAIGCQVGYTAKPVGLDVLNPALDAAAQYNQGTKDSNNQSGDLNAQKTPVVPFPPPTDAEIAAAVKQALEAAAKKADALNKESSSTAARSKTEEPHEGAAKVNSDKQGGGSPLPAQATTSKEVQADKAAE